MQQAPKLQVVIPMAGLGSRFKDYGFKTNKYLLPINTKLEYMIEKAIISLNIHVPCTYYFIINEEHGYDKALRNILHEIAAKHNIECIVSSVQKLTEGPASTVYTIIDQLNMSHPLLVSNSDQVLDWDFEHFYNQCQKYDGCVLTYNPEYELVMGAKDKHSFIRLDEQGKINECREKIVLSNYALVGVHYFSAAQLFANAYKDMIAKSMRAPNGEYYLSLAYQSMLESELSVGYVNISASEHFYPVGEPNDYFKYLYNIGGYKAWCKYCNEYNNEHVNITINDADIQVNIIGYSPMQISNNIIYDNERQYDLNQYVRGWFIGNFEPSLIKTAQLEIGLLTHNKNEKWDFHYHTEADEVNFLLEGRMLLNEQVIEKGMQFIIYKNQIACPVFLEDCKVLCIKTPSVPTDKYCI